MGEKVTYVVNDVNRAIGRMIADLKAFESPYCDGRIRALILTRLEEAQLFSLKLIKEEYQET